jgi:hypothetical protein
MQGKRRWGKGGIWLLLTATCLGAGQAGNIAPDAVTQATQGYNSHIGELAYLTDGLHPDNSEAAALFAWPNKGNLVFQFGEPRLVEGLRLRVGEDAGSYAAIAYLGARLGESGQTETAEGMMVADAYNQDFSAGVWVELDFPPGTQTDYIELSTESGAEFYEIEIRVPQSSGTEVLEATWGVVKQPK